MEGKPIDESGTNPNLQHLGRLVWDPDERQMMTLQQGALLHEAW
jgi:hypothetical protein